LTIFQKMLVAPLAGVLLYSAYLAYTFNELEASRRTVDDIRAVYLPVLEYAGGNVMLFDSMVATFKDAVLAGEEEWVRNTIKEKARIEDNLARLSAYAPIVDANRIGRIEIAFGQYYGNAYALSLAMLRKHPDAEATNRLIENVERYHIQVSTDFDTLKTDLQGAFSRRIDETNRRLQRQVMIAAGLGVVLIVVIVGVTFVMSLSTRKSLREVNMAFKNMAQDTPDFSRRLAHASNDELGELVGWFNLLSDKLEDDHKQIELLSITDKLTQLYNRTKIDELFQMELNKARRYRGALTVILLDLDHFKSVNDNHGHQVGDLVLRELAKILRESVRDTDHVGRWGGEEFVILSPSTDLEQARSLAEKLRAAIADFPFAVAGHRTGSFGVATYREGDDADTMTKRADDCLYLAKNRGRNRVVDETALIA
jgi:diguanylate cyclase (GGDEF)-like protein